MWDEGEIDRYLKTNLKVTRYEHSLGVSSTAVRLAKIYGANVSKARVAGLIHDCAKCMSDSELIDIAERNGIIIDEVLDETPNLLHGPVGSIIARDKMGIHDDEILNAVAYHTTGKEDMSLMEKIIYVADYIEPMRDFPGVDKIREDAVDNLDRALLDSFNNTIKHVIDKKQLLHLNTIKGRNYLISQYKYQYK
ncbi:MAG: bis(5'-nucleosyl)-tetraphosphatase (symmetrical) YqeK [Clostridium sp.]|jgi:predicted HD superfamily hydrolase involved in NAD metabolism|uniref:bis(5'-nucleosyl)-tetraphosphatase (symmetrical) YqeK n=1 Tax=Clostridium sp. TaxID=1506 RepID=UPI0025C0473F|nr:bis(5'-nucleosyl)-tetraphosphatase (symmetrical) YqeK [Clostridium sp.]MCH3964717.1 bis(5'-nucleosyl)-tetraphosphatase (symmetrical) YqeK [Clostridium sp.]MCI1715188.1 bis(5'-nucleosyl)-tetraphosphatase (symmetrical) YqeK [Clostridium sp.]MCI1799450.1 bis(5'-nucleosyl)-tetraphosphatase (symmetrical) YqeK [Clostridium sp.]MCI1813371.1 bis(5'-nucleosyl)-tetraphosphatase (symmetrical) YqeK [Clostridium sp.]MCI1870262.1 bis(5'-nucleosyl)-tetraphosphatase (symmetrical) YqeK [Clostridium sp.]